MDIDGVKQFCDLMGFKDIRVDRERGWVNASCPFAPFRHKSGTDSNPSFGISISKEDMRPQYKCFSCGESGDLRSLIHNLTWLYGHSFPAASNFLIENYPEIFNFEDVDHSNKKKRIKYDKLSAVFDKEPTLNGPVPEAILAKYPLLYADNDWEKMGIDGFDVVRVKYYLEEERKIRPDICERYQLRFYKDPNSRQLGVVFPIISRGKNPATLDLWVRLVEIKRFFRLNAKLTGSRVDYHAPASWFGENLFDREKSTTILVEGAFDLLRLKSLGEDSNVLASMGNPSKEQLRNPNILSPLVYFGFDSDEAGVGFAQMALQEVMAPRVGALNWAFVKKKDAGDLDSVEQYLEVKARHIYLQRKPQGVDILK